MNKCSIFKTNFGFRLFSVLCALFALCASTFLQAETKMLAFSASDREGSFNKKLILEAVGMARESGADVNLISLKDYQLPFYNADLEAKEGMPAQAKALRQLMIQSEVIIISSPEYNGSLPAVLKNIIDWASRSETGGSSRDAFKGKTFIIMSASPGGGGGARGLVHLRTIIENIGGTVIPQQIVIPTAHDAFDEQGHLKDIKFRDQLHQMIQSVIVK